MSALLPAGTKVLVTGASGFLGGAVCARLLTDGGGVDVVAVSRREPPADHPRLRWIRADLADPETARAVVAEAGPDVVLHLAGHAAGGRDRDLVLPTLRSNLLGTVNVLLAASERGCRRLVHAGSMEEPAPTEPDQTATSPYAASKWSAAAYVRMFHALYGLPAVALRIFMVYGPGERALGKVIPYAIRSFLAGEAPALSSGARLVDWVYIDDVVDAVLAAAAADGVEGRTIDVGSGRRTSIREVVETIARVMGTSVAPAFGRRPDRPFERSPVADPDDACTLLGWRPSVPLDEGLRRTVAWLRDGGGDGEGPGRPAGPVATGQER